jgi:hypothetical protein
LVDVGIVKIEGASGFTTGVPAGAAAGCGFSAGFSAGLLAGFGARAGPDGAVVVTVVGATG